MYWVSHGFIVDLCEICGLSHDLLVFRYKYLHECPCYEVGNRADAEYRHISGFLTLKAEERVSRSCILRICEEHAGSLVDQE